MKLFNEKFECLECGKEFITRDEIYNHDCSMKDTVKKVKDFGNEVDVMVGVSV